MGRVSSESNLKFLSAGWLAEGGTTDFTEEHLYGYGAGKVERIVLVKKIKDPPVERNIAMFGFEAPDVWLTGMGMDNTRIAPEANRWAGWIAIAHVD